MPEFIHQPRKYLHFDAPPSSEVAEAVATDPERVAKHPFYPFLGFTIKTPRIKKDEFGGFQKSPKKRPIKLAAHMDAAICSHYAAILKERYEAQVVEARIEHCVTAFRRQVEPGRNNIFFANEVFEYIQKNRPCVALGLDVEKFFDRLDHEVLKERWQATLGVTRLPADHFALFKYLTRFTWVDKEKAFDAVGISRHNPRPKGLRRLRICSAETFRDRIRGAGLVWPNPTEGKGIPQGSPISALLSNIYMFAFDQIMHEVVQKVGGLYRRYCDDILIVVPPENSNRIQRRATEEIARLRLTLNEGKTAIVSFPKNRSQLADEGKFLQYLGFDFNGKQKLIRSSSLVRYYGKMRRGVSLAKQTQRKENKRRVKEGLPTTKLRTRKLQIRYSYLIKRRFELKNGQPRMSKENFITYAFRAANQMNAPEIKRQVRNHWNKLREEMAKPL